jgi:hypothetical protein
MKFDHHFMSNKKGRYNVPLPPCVRQEAILHHYYSYVVNFDLLALNSDCMQESRIIYLSSQLLMK